MNKKERNILKHAFTLVEVIITLGVIGVVVVMTVQITNSVNKKDTVVALKKAYSVLSSAYNFTKQENGPPDGWGMVANSGDGALTMMNMFAPYLKIVKNCGTEGDCFPDVDYKNYNNSTWGNLNIDSQLTKVKLLDGSLLAANVTSANCDTDLGSTLELQNICGYFYIDINGYKSPNQVGKDFFLVYLTKYGMLPVGTQHDAWNAANQFGNPNLIGWGCTAWVLYNENTDYLNCGSNLSWEGPTSCNRF